jgi:chromosome segregation ATPase
LNIAFFYYSDFYLFLVSVISHLEEDVSDLTIQLSELQSCNEDLSESKVRLEMRAVDLEEQRDRAGDESRELEVTIGNLKSELKVIFSNLGYIFT